MKQVYTYNPKSDSFEFFQSFYMTRYPKRIKPNVVILDSLTNEIIFETNAYGFKGPEVDPTKRLVAVWGDSVVFGIGRGWVEGIARYFKGYQFLNGGLEGDQLENILERVREANAKLRITANILFPGWHNLDRLNTIRPLLTQFINEFPRPILCTVPTSLCEEVLNTDISHLFIPKRPVEAKKSYTNLLDSLNSPSVFYFWGNLTYSIDNARELWKSIIFLNCVVRHLGHEHNIPIVDLFSHLRPSGLNDFRNDFFDVGHPRPSSYLKIQQIFAIELRDVLV